MKLSDQHAWADSIAEWGWAHNFDTRKGVHRGTDMNTAALTATVDGVFEDGRAKVLGAIGDSVIEAHVDSELREFKQDLLAAIAAAAEPAGWQPIETAPKTGRTILLGCFSAHGKWRTMRGQWFSAESIAEEWENDEAVEGWYETAVEPDDEPNCWKIEPTHWQPLPAALVAAQPSYQPCKGTNCGATDGVSHSPECFAEHAATVDAGRLDTPGNRNPDDRYDGYKGRPLRAGATADQQAAHAEGVRAAQPEAPAEPSAAEWWRQRAVSMDEHPAAKRGRERFEFEHGELSDVMSAVMHWKSVAERYSDALNRDREEPTTDKDLDAALAGLHYAIRRHVALAAPAAQQPAELTDDEIRERLNGFEAGPWMMRMSCDQIREVLRRLVKAQGGSQ